jgi:hypothetical protein
MFLAQLTTYLKNILIALFNTSIGTLLNLLFGTNFPVMDSTDGRQQTTQGVWMGKTTAISPKV